MVQKTVEAIKPHSSFHKCLPHTITKKEPELPLPPSFELPHNYHIMVMSELKKGMLSIRAKPKFISAVASAIFRYKSYPTTDEYERVGKLIISKYPFLRSSNGTGFVS